MTIFLKALRFDMKKRAKIIIPIIIIAVAIAFFYINRLNKTDMDKFAGVVEATDYNLAFEFPGTIEKIYFPEGAPVKKGDLLVTLDQETVKSQLKQAVAAMEAAKANYEKLKSGSRPQEISQARAQLNQAKAILEQYKNGPTQEEIAAARARMLAARSQYHKAQKGSRKEVVQETYHRLQAAQSTYKTARKDYQRYTNLLKEGVVPRQKYDQAENQYKQAKSTYNAVQEQYRMAKEGARKEDKKSAYQNYRTALAQYRNLAKGTRPEIIKQGKAQVEYWKNRLALLVEGPRKEDVKAAEKQLNQAKAAVDIARERVKKSKIFAPANGVIISHNFEEKEMTAAGAPVITMAELGRPWVYIFVPEPEIGKLKLGDKAKITVDSYPKREFVGEVVRIYEKTEYTPKFIQTRRERVNLVFRVKVAVENPEGVIKPGMPADVVIVNFEK